MEVDKPSFWFPAHKEMILLFKSGKPGNGLDILPALNLYCCIHIYEYTLQIFFDSEFDYGSIGIHFMIADFPVFVCEDTFMCTSRVCDFVAAGASDILKS
jgi:hypothetical protein